MNKTKRKTHLSERKHKAPKLSPITLPLKSPPKLSRPNCHTFTKQLQERNVHLKSLVEPGAELSTNHTIHAQELSGLATGIRTKSPKRFLMCAVIASNRTFPESTRKWPQGVSVAADPCMWLRGCWYQRSHFRKREYLLSESNLLLCSYFLDDRRHLGGKSRQY